MRKLHQFYSPQSSIKDWVDGLETKYGPFVTCDMLCKVLESYGGNMENVIVTGFRQIEGIQYMIEYFKPEDYEILFIDGNFDLLKNNFISRENKKVSDEWFKEYLLEEEEWGLANLRQYVLSNKEHCRYVNKKNNEEIISTNIFNKTKKLKLMKNGEKI